MQAKSESEIKVGQTIYCIEGLNFTSSDITIEQKENLEIMLNRIDSALEPMTLEEMDSIIGLSPKSLKIH